MPCAPAVVSLTFPNVYINYTNQSLQIPTKRKIKPEIIARTSDRIRETRCVVKTIVARAARKRGRGKGNVLILFSYELLRM